MIINYGSDLHLEFQELDNWRPCNFDGARVLILAGDICTVNTATYFVDFFNHIAQEWEFVLITSGNHEYYGAYFEEADLQFKEFYSRWSNFTYLHSRTGKIQTTIAGINFVGTTLWSDIRSPVVQQYVQGVMNDYRRIRIHGKRFLVRDTVAEFHKQFAEIKNSIKENTVIFTHYAPSFESSLECYKTDPVTHAYATSLENFIFDNPEIKFWIHGHMHNKSDYLIGDTRILCNPRGYVGHEPISEGYTFENFSLTS